jgi:hypothetical protein
LTEEVAIFLPSLIEEENVQAVVQRVLIIVPSLEVLKPLHALYFSKCLLSVSGASKLSPIPLDGVQATIHLRPNSVAVSKGPASESREDVEVRSHGDRFTGCVEGLSP